MKKLALPQKTDIFIKTIKEINELPKGIYACYFVGTPEQWGKYSEENKTLKQKLWDLSDSGDAILVQEHIHDAVNAYLILKTVQPLTPSLSHGIIPRMEKSSGYIELFR
jgi:hypothetical protein